MGKKREDGETNRVAQNADHQGREQAELLKNDSKKGNGANPGDLTDGHDSSSPVFGDADFLEKRFGKYEIALVNHCIDKRDEKQYQDKWQPEKFGRFQPSEGAFSRDGRTRWRVRQEETECCQQQ